MDGPRIWQTAAATVLVMASMLLSGCAALDLLGGELPGGEDESEPLIQTTPYPAARQTSERPPDDGPPSASGQPPAPIVSPAEARQTSGSPAAAPPVQAAASDQEPPPAASAEPAAEPPATGQPAAENTAGEQAAATPAEAKSQPSPADTAAEQADPPAAAKPAAAPPLAEAADEAAAAKTSEEKTSAAATSQERTPEQRLSDLLQQRDALIAALESEIGLRDGSSEDEAELLRLEQQLRLLYLLAERPDDAVREVASLPPAEQEAFKQLLFGLSTWLSPEEDRRAALRNARVLRSLRDAAAHLSTAAKLDVANLRFCESVEGFGWYQEFPTAQFRARQQVILYAEVANFATEKKGADTFETELKVSYQIFDAGGALVEERELPLDKETCRNQRRDYFLAYRIYLPDGIPAGRYRLELTVEDLKAPAGYQGRKLGTGLIDFSIRQ